MKNLFYILALLVTGAAIYFSWDNQQKLQNQKDIFLKTKDENGVVTASISKTEKELKDETAGLVAARKLRDERVAAIEAANSKKLTLERELAETEGTIDEQSKKLEDLEKIRKKIEDTLGGAGVTLEELPEKVAQIREEKKGMDKRLEELNTLVEGARGNVAKNKTEMGRLADRKAVRDNRISGNGKESVITGVNHEWGFVIVGAGSKTGFTPQTELIVKRDGRMIGKLKPSAIEPNQTVAEIDMESLSPGVRLRPGDTVIVAKPAT